MCTYLSILGKIELHALRILLRSFMALSEKKKKACAIPGLKEESVPNGQVCRCYCMGAWGAPEASPQLSSSQEF